MRKQQLALLALVSLFFIQSCDYFKSKPAVIGGEVVEASSENAVEGATVEITQPENFQQSTLTNSSGRFSFDIEPDDGSVSITIEASKEGYQSATRNVEVSSNDEINDLVIELTTEGNDDNGEGDGNGGDGTGYPDSEGSAFINLEEITNSEISVNGVGGTESTQFTFVVTDSSGNPLGSNNEQYVRFHLLSGPNGGESIAPDSVLSENGMVTATLKSGTASGVVQVQASFVRDSNEGTVAHSTKPISVVIHGGYPNPEYFNIASSQYNINREATENLPTINVDLGDKYSNPVKPGTSIYFETTSGIIQGSASTDDDGKASVDFTSLEPIKDEGNVTVTASTGSESGNEISKEIDLIFSSSETDIQVTPSSFELKSGESQEFQYTITDIQGHPMAEGTTIQVQGDEGIELSGDTDITLGDNLKGGSGQTTFSFTASDDGTSEKESIEFSINVTTPTGTSTTYDEISGTRIIEGSETVGAAAIVLTDQPEDAININETGDNVSTSMTFQVQDSLGRPLTSDNAVDVSFSIINGPDGGEDLVPATATTDGSGNVTTTLFSGNTAGEIKVQALVNRDDGIEIKSSPIVVAIHGGFPDQNYFSIAAENNNFEGWDINNNRNVISTVVGDQFSNPVKPGTVVYFSTTGGIIQGSGQTDEDGIVEVELISGDPRPAGGVAEVTASTKGEDGQDITKQIPIVFSSKTAQITADPTTFDLDPGGGESFDYTVEDENGNPMAKGTQISIEAGEGIELTGDVDFTLGDHIDPGPGATEFSFSIRDTDDESNEAADLTIKINVTTPSGNTTTYSEIEGIRRKGL